ncbi:MAG TPA: HEAT repeat domain-containing protein [Solirubrobacterales bacterium]|nr:HEAT repeat domain-containing protein [Solirubrobacterales bacterium]
MIQLLTWSVIGLATVFVSLVATIVTRRFLADRRRRRERSLRPAIETAMVEHLAADDPEPMPAPAGKAARDLLRTVALETMAELRGRERLRLVALLERSGIVAETAAGLGSRRRRARRAAAEALRQIGSEEAVRSLLAGLGDPDLDTRLTCAAALAELADEELVPAVLAIADRAASDRAGAVAAILVTLGRRHPSTLGGALAPGASPELRRLAAAVTGELRLAEHVLALREALGSEDDELAARAARGLGAIGDAEAVDLLLGPIEDDSRASFVRLAATGALGAIGDPRSVGPLEHELHSAGWLLQSKAAQSLRLLGMTGEEALRRALGSPVTAVRDHARVALER